MSVYKHKQTYVYNISYNLLDDLKLYNTSIDLDKFIEHLQSLKNKSVKSCYDDSLAKVPYDRVIVSFDTGFDGDASNLQVVGYIDETDEAQAIRIAEEEQFERDQKAEKARQRRLRDKEHKEYIKKEAKKLKLI